MKLTFKIITLTFLIQTVKANRRIVFPGENINTEKQLITNMPCDVESGYKDYLGQCYLLLSQGPCDKKNWFVLGNDGIAYCKTRECKEGFIFFEGTCVDAEKYSCNKGMVLYVDSTGEASCDCYSGFYYDPVRDTCFTIYDQGPCNDGYHLKISGSSQLIECVKNPCRFEGLFYNQNDKKCYAKKFRGECDAQNINFTERGEAFCLRINNFSLFGKTRDNDCPLGSKLSFFQKCRSNFNFRARAQERTEPQNGRCPHGYYKTLFGSCQKSRCLFC